MKLSEFLELSGWSKKAVARKLQISPPAVSLWAEIPEKHLEVLMEALSSAEDEPAVVRVCHPMDLPDDEMEAIIRNRAAVSDWDICQERGWRIHELNAAIAAWVKRNPYKKPENGYDLSRYSKGWVVGGES